MKSFFKLGCWSLAAIALFLPVVFSCGGGGGGGPVLSGGTVNAANAGTAAAIAFSAGDTSGLGEDLLGTFSASAPQGSLSVNDLSSQILDMVKAEVLQADSGLMGTQGSHELQISPCMHASYTWSGPELDQLTNECDIVNLRAEVTMTDCSDLGVTMDGTAIVQLQGSICDFTSFSVQFVNFTATDGVDSVSMNNLTMSFTESGATFTNTFNGDMTMTIDGESFDSEFSNYTMVYVPTGETTGEVTISGAVTSSCLDGWLTFTTTSPILVDENEDCPNGGVITVSGEGSATVTFNSDGSVRITSGGDIIDYPSCLDVDICGTAAPSGT